MFVIIIHGRKEKRHPAMTDTTIETTERLQHPVTPIQWVLEFAMTVSFLLLLAGLLLPALSITSFGFIGREYSILEGIDRFYRNGQELIGTVVLFFSVILPLAKLIAGFLLLNRWNHSGARAQRTLAFLMFVSKWSMADVFVLALTILIINGQLITSADLRPGVAFFTVGVLLSSLCMIGINRLVAVPRTT